MKPTNRPLPWLCLALWMALLLPGPLVWGTQDLASALVRDTSERMLVVLKQRRPELDQNPRLIYQLVQEIVIPHFDFQRITQSAMGRHWRAASPEQQRALVMEFRQLLVRTYAKALLNYSDRRIQYLPLRPGSGAEDVLVRTQVSEGGGSAVPIDYRLYLLNGAWKVYDVIIDGVSLVANYRTSFATEVGRQGIDGLIGTLRTRNQAGAS